MFFNRQCISIVVCIATACLASQTSGTVLTATLDFPHPAITSGTGTCVVRIEGLPVFADPGEPLLPVYTYRVLLPQGEEVVRVTALPLEERGIELDLPVAWERHPVPLGFEGPIQAVTPSAAVYNNGAPFPAARAKHVTTQTYRGYRIAYVRVHPVVYRGGVNQLVYAPRIDLEIEAAPSMGPRAAAQRMLRPGHAADRAHVLGRVDDASQIDSYRADDRPALGSGILDPSFSYPNIIITSIPLAPPFQDVKALRNGQGLRTGIVAVSSIAAAYTGIDLPDKIRKFITDAYLDWETEYVLLAGDDEIIPHRGLYGEILPSVIDDDVPADIYYAALDGNWNTDGDGYWGEPGEADLMPDICLGRAPVSTLTEASNFTAKLIRYETAPVAGQIENVLMTGELLYDEGGVKTYGSDSKEEIIGGTDAHGFTTIGIPADWNFTTLFDRDLYPAVWSKYDVIGAINGGTHIVNHLGHSINNITMKMYNSDVLTSFTNDGITNSYVVAFIQGCYTAAFDNRTTDGSYVDDAIGEHFIFIENGAVAYIGTTRYGASAHESTRGAGHYYDRQFFDAIFGEGITTVGGALDDAKIDNVPYVDYRGMRWSHYAIVLFGDPAMDIWTAAPGTLALEPPPVVHTSENEICIRVADGGMDVSGARVSIFTDSTYNAVGYTDGSGTVYLDPDIDQPGEIFVAAKAHNYYAALETLQVVSPDQAILVIESMTIDDDGAAPSSGDADGMADAGETVETVIAITNIGPGTAADAQGRLGTNDPYVTMLDSACSYGNIGPGMTATPAWSYLYAISPGAADGHTAAFELTLDYGDTSLVRHFDVELHAPVLSVSAVVRDDTNSGNGNGCLEVGETVEVSVCLANAGSGDADSVDLTLMPASCTEIVLGASTIPDIPAGEERWITTPFVVTVLPGCPDHREIALPLDVVLACGRQAACTTAVYTGGLLEDDFESGDVGWTHTELIKGFVDEWHLETYRNHTPGGGTSWKCGGPGGAKYQHYSYAALETPELCLGPDASLTFWHWMQAEMESGDYASDGGFVEISIDGGGTWLQIVPLGYYPHTIYPGSSNPVPDYTPCYGWTDGWTQAVFDLSAYEGAARIRFTFAGGSHVGTEEGWYIDDVVVTSDVTAVDETDDLIPDPSVFALRCVFPNPVSSSGAIRFDIPRPSRVVISVYDVMGRLIDTVRDARHEPGRYVHAWDCRGRAPGIYFVRMQAAGYDVTRKVVVLR